MTTLRQSWRAQLELLKRFSYEFEDFYFEKRYSLNISGIIKPEDLITDNRLSAFHANAYHAVWNRNLRKLLSEASATGVKFRNFYDLGSGKGKACFYAALRQPFDRIVGLEFSPPLIEIANLNKSKLKASNIELIHGDAVSFKLPEEDSLIFMFNPFGAHILEHFLTTNKDHFHRCSSMIAYANDIERSTLARFGFEVVFRDQFRKISLHKYPH